MRSSIDGSNICRWALCCLRPSQKMIFKLHFSPEDAASPAKFPDRCSLMSSSFLRVPQLDSAAHWSTPDSRLYCAAAIIDQASASGTLQNRFSVRFRTMSTRMFSCFSCFHFAFVLLPEAYAWLFWSLLCSSGLDSGLLTHTCSYGCTQTAGWCWFFFLQVVQLHVGEEMQPGTFERGAEEARGEYPLRSSTKLWPLISVCSCRNSSFKSQLNLWMLGGWSAISNKPLKHKWARMKEKGRHPASSETSSRGLSPSDCRAGEHPGRRPMPRFKASFSKNLSS